MLRGLAGLTAMLGSPSSCTASWVRFASNARLTTTRVACVPASAGAAAASRASRATAVVRRLRVTQRCCWARRALAREVGPASATHGALQLRLVHLRPALDALALRLGVELLAGAPTRSRVRAQAASTRRRDVVDRRAARGLRLAGPGALLVDRAGRDLLGLLRRPTALLEAVLDVLVLPLTLSAPPPWHRDAPFDRVCCAVDGVPPVTAGMNVRRASARRGGDVDRQVAGHALHLGEQEGPLAPGRHALG